MLQVTDDGDLDQSIAFEVVERNCIWLYYHGGADRIF